MRVSLALIERLKPGDLILTGSPNFFSYVTRKLTDSRFGHAAVVIDSRRILELTDIALTVCERDEGTRVLTFEQFHDRTSECNDLLALRPQNLDRPAFIKASEHIIRHSPTYPTIGAFLLGLSCALYRPVERLPLVCRQSAIELLVHMVTDGPQKMHCAELVVRLYHAAEFKMVFDQQVLEQLIDQGGCGACKMLPLPTVARDSQVGTWPRNPLVAARSALRCFRHTVRERLDPSVARDHADLTLPADFEHARRFNSLFDLSRNRSGWSTVSRPTA